jgi:hypothetical protein
MISVLKYLPFGILMLTYFPRNAEAYCKCIGSINNKKSLIKITKIDPLFTKPRSEKDYYIETWDEGEVSWDFPESSIEISNSGEACFQVYKKNKNAYDNTIYEKYFKNRLYLRIRTSYIKEAYSSFIKYAYRDTVKFETFAYDIQDLAVNNIKGASIESDLVLLLLASALGLLYNNNKAESIETLKLSQQSTRSERLETYREIRRNTGIFFVVIMTIFGRNIKNAE